MLTVRKITRTALLLVLTQAAAPGAYRVEAQPAGQAGAAIAQDSAPVVLPATMAVVPFGVGEKMEYELKYSAIRVGTGGMEVREIVNVRGEPSWHTKFNIKGKALGFGVDIVLESWFDVVKLNLRRFYQDQRYARTKKIQRIEIYPERGIFQEEGHEERVTVTDPLDEGSLFYFVRTIPLEVGKTYEFSRYYKPDANPVRIFVARRETVKTPAGTFKTIVLQPKIKAGGIFGEKGKAEVWLTDDSTRMMVQLKSDLTFGSINLFLTKATFGKPAKP